MVLGVLLVVVCSEMLKVFGVFLVDEEVGWLLSSVCFGVLLCSVDVCEWF